MNYHPVSVANQTNSGAGFQDSFDAEKAGEKVTQTYVLFPAWSAGSMNPQDNDKDALVDGKEHGVDSQKSVSADVHFSSSSAQTRKQADKTEREDKGKSPIESFTGYRDLNAEFEEYSNNSSNGVNAVSSSVPTAGHNFINNTNNFSAVDPSNTAVSPTYEKSSFQDASTSSHDPDMPALEDFTYSDDDAAVGAEADINNLESSIPEEGIDYEEVFAPVARIKAIRLILAYASFMGFLVKQKKDGIFISQDKYVAEILRKFRLTEGKSASTPIDAEKPLLKDPDGEDVDVHTYRIPFDLVAYSDSDYAGASLDRKSTTAAANGCAQVLWIQNQLLDYRVFNSPMLYLLRVEMVLNSPCPYWVSKNWLVQKQMALGKDILNPLMADNCPKIIWFSTHHIALMKSWLVQKQTNLGRKFNFSNYIFDSLVKNVDSSSKFYMYPRFIQLLIQNQLGDLSTHTTKYISPALTQKVFANIRRTWKGFLGVETPLFKGMVVVREDVAAEFGEEQIPDDTTIAAAQEVVTTPVLEDVLVDSIPSPAPPTPPPQSLKKVGTSQRVETSDDTIMKDVSNQGRMIVELDKDEGVELIGEKEKTKEVKDIVDNAQVKGRQAEKQAEIYQIDLDHPSKVLSMQEDDSEVQEAVEVVTTAKLITEVVNAASTPVSAASIIIPTTKQNILAVTITVALVKVAAASTRRRRGVVIRDPEEESSAKTSDETKSKDKGKGILVEEPKPMKKKKHVEMDKAYARKLHEELNQDIDWDVAIEHVKQKAKEDPFIQRYQVMMKRPQTEAQAQRNDYSKEQIEEEESRALESINETPAQKAAKRRRLNQENKDVEEIKQHLEIMPDEDDNVYTKATPLARKVSVVDYQIILLNKKPRYKIIKAMEHTSSSELMLPRSLKKNIKCVNDAGEELSAVKYKLMLLDTAAKRI
nr:hypothetical protein [Tanacetum cinerariifolium]